MTTPKNEQSKSSRNVTNSRGKAVLSFCFPCSFTIHVNSKLMRTIFYSHNKFTNYIFHNSPDILCFSKVKKLNLKGNSVERNRLSPLVPSNSVEYSGIRRTGSTNLVTYLRLSFQFKSQLTNYSWHRHAIALSFKKISEISENIKSVTLFIVHLNFDL